MALLNWSNEYSVGIRSLDAQHRKLFDMLNELHDAMKVGRGQQTAPAILKKLVTYTCEHFAEEERLMLRAGYVELAGHKMEHDKLIGEVQKLVRDFEEGNVVLSMEMQDFLLKWLKDHIQGCDKRYSEKMGSAAIQ